MGRQNRGGSRQGMGAVDLGEGSGPGGGWCPTWVTWALTPGPSPIGLTWATQIYPGSPIGLADMQHDVRGLEFPSICTQALLY